MRSLLLLRHAKSSWDDPSLRDHDRPLSPRGRRAAADMGRYLRSHDLTPELVLCSSARRTCETAALADLPGSTRLEIEHDLYLADPETVAERVRAVDDDVNSVMVVGHNPTTQDLAMELVGDDPTGAVARLAAKYPTGALAVFELSQPWRELRPGAAILSAFVTPRDVT
jgi:phosphohistidine phosphatase